MSRPCVTALALAALATLQPAFAQPPTEKLAARQPLKLQRPFAAAKIGAQLGQIDNSAKHITHQIQAQKDAEAAAQDAAKKDDERSQGAGRNLTRATNALALLWEAADLD